MLFSEKIRELTRNRTLAQLAREAKLGDHLKNWRNGRADKFGPDHWEPIIRLADACDLNAEQTTELLGAAQKSSFDELQYCEPNEVLRKDNKATQAAIRSIQSRAHSPDQLFGAEQSPITVNTVDFTPAEELSNDALTRALEIAKKSNRRLVLGYALIGVVLAFVITMFVSPSAREAAVRTAAPIMERLEQWRGDSPPDTPSDPTPGIEILPTPEPTLANTPQQTPTSNSLPTSAPEVVATATIIISTTSTPAENSGATPIVTSTLTVPFIVSPTSTASSSICKREVISQDGSTSVPVYNFFEGGTSMQGVLIDVGTMVTVLDDSREERYQIVWEINGQRETPWISVDNLDLSEPCN